MASARQSAVSTSADTTTETVTPSVDQPTEGVSTMKDLFGKASVVDEVVEIPMQPGQEQASWIPQWFVIRPNKDIENMTVGVPEIHYAFKAMQRYRVPFDVAKILFDRDHLAEVPYPQE